MKLQNYPAMAAYIVNLVMAAVVSFHFLPAATAHGVAVAVVALTSLVVAFMVHPFVLGAATGAFQTFAVALSAYWLHLSDQQTGSVVALFGLIAAVITHTLVVPLVAHRQGATVTELERGQARRAAAR